MEGKNHYDAIVIGFGKGGKTLAAALGNAGKRTALIERPPEMYSVFTNPPFSRVGLSEQETSLRDMIFTHPIMSEALNDLFNL